MDSLERPFYIVFAAGPGASILGFILGTGIGTSGNGAIRRPSCGEDASYLVNPSPSGFFCRWRSAASGKAAGVA